MLAICADCVTLIHVKAIQPQNQMKIKKYKVSFRLAASDSAKLEFTVKATDEDVAVMEVDGVSVEGSWFAYKGETIATIKTTRIYNG